MFDRDIFAVRTPSKFVYSISSKCKHIAMKYNKAEPLLTYSQAKTQREELACVTNNPSNKLAEWASSR